MTETPPPEPHASPQSGEANPLGFRRPTQPPGEVGGPQGPEPTRYGDWQIKGRVSDF